MASKKNTIIDLDRNTRKFEINNQNELELKKFPDNTIKTAKYNIFTFIPVALVYQFTNYFNIYFLIVTVILSIEVISNMDPGVALGPFIAVLAMSMIREGLEDLKKARYDKTYNNSQTLIYDNIQQTFVKTEWFKVKVGKILKILKNESVPADILVIKSSANNGICYLETSNLDGENALKARETLKLNINIEGEKDLINVKGIIEVDEPNKNIYCIDGCVIQTNNEEGEKLYFNIDNIVLRGGTLKNVDYIYGIVVYTGKETKLMKNINNQNYKISSLERKVNKVIIYVIIFVLIICVIGTILGTITKYNMFYKNKHFYLFSSTEETFETIFEACRFFGANFILFNNIIPISMVVTLQIVKGAQILLMERDKLMKHSPDDKFKCLSMRLQEDLGNLKFIFSDKTGTLTKNEMEFKACSIFTKLYYDDEANQSFTNNADKQQNDVSGDLILTSNNNNAKSFFSKTFDKFSIIYALKNNDENEMAELGDAPFNYVKESTYEFFLNIVLNHGVLTETETLKNGNVIKLFQGSNPDELTLVQAANEIGIKFVERVGNVLTIDFLGEEKIFEVLHRFEFSSARLRSSIIVKDVVNNRVKMYMKGADSVIMSEKTLDNYSLKSIFNQTKDHLDKFAKDGLRTLCFCMKYIDENELAEFNEKYNQIKYKVINNANKALIVQEIEKLISGMEADMILLGVTGLEDKLQDCVRDDINEFMEAGINVWMLTGDKMDTAESIAYSCKLFNDDTEVIKIKAEKREKTLENLKSILEFMENLERELIIMKLERRRKQNKMIEEDIKSNLRKKRAKTENYYNLGDEVQNKLLKRNLRRNVKSPDPVNIVRRTKLGSVSENQDAVSNHHLNIVTKKIKRNIPLPQSQRENKEINLEIKNFQSELDGVVPIQAIQVRKPSLLANRKKHSANNLILIKDPNIEENSTTKKYYPRMSLMSRKDPQEEYFSDSHRPVKGPRAKTPQFKIKNIYDLFKQNNIPIPEELIEFRHTTSYRFRKFAKNSNLSKPNFRSVNTDTVNKKEEDKRITHNEKIEVKEKCELPEIKIHKPKIQKGPMSLQQFQINNIMRHNMAIDSDEGDPSVSKNEEAMPSDVDDYSIIKFMLDKNYFEGDDIHHDINHNLADSIELGEDQRNLIEINEQKIKKVETDLNTLVDYYKDQIRELELKKNNVLGFRFTWNVKGDLDKNRDFSIMNFGLLIEGNAISQCLDAECREVFWKIIMKSKSVVCCRCSPIQKSEVVNFVKNKSQTVTLAIGDGGNDINMIKAANVGVGIFGKEGYQAAFSSDFAISQFRHLKRLIFYHGRYYSLRNSYFIYYFFYKSIIYSLPNLWFMLFSAHSGVLIWDDLYFLVYNAFATNILVSIRAMTEEDIDMNFEGYPNNDIMKDLIPDIYKDNRNSKPFNMVKFLLVFIGGIIHSLVAVYLPILAMGFGVIDDSGYTSNIWFFSCISYLSILVFQSWVIIIDSYYFSHVTCAVYAIHFISNIVFTLVRNFANTEQLGGVTFDLLGTAHFWFTLIITCAVGIYPYLFFNNLMEFFSNGIIIHLRYKKYEFDYSKKVYLKKIEQMTKCKRQVARFRKIYKSENNMVAENYADKRMQEMVHMYRTTKMKSTKNVVNNITNDLTATGNNMKLTVKVNNKTRDNDLAIIEQSNIINNSISRNNQVQVQNRSNNFSYNNNRSNSKNKSNKYSSIPEVNDIITNEYNNFANRNNITIPRVINNEQTQKNYAAFLKNTNNRNNNTEMNNSKSQLSINIINNNYYTHFQKSEHNSISKKAKTKNNINENENNIKAINPFDMKDYSSGSQMGEENVNIINNQLNNQGIIDRLNSIMPNVITVQEAAVVYDFPMEIVNENTDD